MNTLAIKKLKAQLLATQAAKAELELKAEERREDIRRIEDHIKLQEKRELELTDQLNALNEESK